MLLFTLSSGDAKHNCATADITKIIGRDVAVTIFLNYYSITLTNNISKSKSN